MKKDSKIFVAGHKGLAGSAIVRVLKDRGFTNVLTADRARCDLENTFKTLRFFNWEKPEFVFLCAAKVGGILANKNNPVDFMVRNLRIQTNVLEAASKYGVEKLLFLGSACAYPKHAECPVKESALLTGPLEESNECYALAKISGVKLCDAYRAQYSRNFISAMPTNLYGPGDHYDPRDSHVIPGMIRRLHNARGGGYATLWGTGKPTREFLFSEDLARACLVLMEKYNSAGTINVGTREPVPLRGLAELVAYTVGYKGPILWDSSKPDGTPHRSLNSSKVFELGWRPEMSLACGLDIAYRDFLCQLR
jgi:GDP-L-fucose synthase